MLFPPDTYTTSGLEVVLVHHDVDSEVECDEHPGNRGLANKFIAEQNRCAVVINVQESQRLLHENEEDSIQQIKILGEVVEIVRTRRFCDQPVLPQNAAVETIVPESWDELLDEEDQKTARDHRETEVVDE